MVIPSAIRQIFGKDTAKGLSYVAMIMMTAPMIAPAMGSFLTLLSGWRSIFIFLSLYASLMLLLAFFFFPERPQEKRRKQAITLGCYKKVLSNRTCTTLVLASMFASLTFFTYLTSVSFLYMQVFGLTEGVFSLLFGINVLGFIVANFVNTRVVHYIGSYKMLTRIVAVTMALSLGLILQIFTGAPYYLIILCIILLISINVLVAVNADALFLQYWKGETGTASAVIGTLKFGMGAVSGPILTFFYESSGKSVVVLMFISVLAAFVCIWLFNHKKYLQGIAD